MITVTKVNITKDLSIARVYLSLFATKDKAALLESIVQRTPEIRFTLGRAVKDQLRQILHSNFMKTIRSTTSKTLSSFFFPNSGNRCNTIQ